MELSPSPCRKSHTVVPWVFLSQNRRALLLSPPHLSSPCLSRLIQHWDHYFTYWHLWNPDNQCSLKIKIQVSSQNISAASLCCGVKYKDQAMVWWYHREQPWTKGSPGQSRTSCFRQSRKVTGSSCQLLIVLDHNLNTASTLRADTFLQKWRIGKLHHVLLNKTFISWSIFDRAHKKYKLQIYTNSRGIRSF